MREVEVQQIPDNQPLKKAKLSEEVHCICHRGNHTNEYTFSAALFMTKVGYFLKTWLHHLTLALNCSQAE